MDPAFYFAYIMKKQNSLILALLVFVACQPVKKLPEVNLQVPDDALHVVVFGDWGRQGEYHQKDNADAMGVAATKLDAEFIISLGDNFYPSGVASTTDPLWNSSFNNIYTAHSLHVKWNVVLGNHDYRGNPQAQVDYTKISRRWNMPARYFSEEIELDDDSGKKALFVYIDTNPYEKKYYEEGNFPENLALQDTAKQRRWIDSVLSNSTATWKFVSGHHPMYTGGKRYGLVNTVRESLEDVFEKNRVDAYFAGHEHDLQHNVVKTVHHFVSGAGSEVRPTGKVEFTRFSASTTGFMTLSITGTETLVQAIDYNGKILYTTKLTK